MKKFLSILASILLCNSKAIEDRKENLLGALSKKIQKNEANVAQSDCTTKTVNNN